ncbi:hypothetical protein AB4093_22225, partial [Inquilinus sp. 2KB_12]|uniref:hypothetical protein n=1 Tax=Inquilinus sp. 2KB_12 TaxID=3232975 RepID=UPI003F913D94
AGVDACSLSNGICFTSFILLRLRMRPKTPRRRGAGVKAQGQGGGRGIAQSVACEGAKRSGALQAADAAETWGGPVPWRP